MNVVEELIRDFCLKQKQPGRNSRDPSNQMQQPGKHSKQTKLQPGKEFSTEQVIFVPKVT